MDQTQKQLIVIIESNPEITKRELSKKLNLSISNVQRVLDELRDSGIIERKGTNRKGYWEVVDEKITFKDSNLDQTSENEKEVIELIKYDPSITKRELANKLKISESKIQRILDSLKKKNLIKREGSNRKGRWVVI